MSLTKKQLEKLVAAGYRARNELQEREDAKLNKQNAKLIGTCQKFRNSYDEGEKWWLYRRIDSVNGRWCTAFKFQIKPKNSIEIEFAEHGSLGESWLPCTHAEFYEAYNTLLDLLPSSAPNRS